MTLLAGAATSDSRFETLVAGLDLVHLSEKVADALAVSVAGELAAQGARGVQVATHWAAAGDVRHVALSIECGALDPDALRGVLSNVVAARGEARDGYAMQLGDRFAGDQRLRGCVRDAVTAQVERRSGRAVIFPGSAQLVGTVTVRRITASSAIDRVVVLGGGDAAPETLVRTRDFVRPRFSAGELVLHVQPAVGGTLVPFENPSPTPCCADHA
jgi:hypothetical protein